MTIKALYPSTGPSLNLNFARTKVLDPRITFTRASTGTFTDANGLIQSAAVNIARFDHDPATEESLGLLLEEARTNLFTYSEQFDISVWTKSSTTVAVNATTAPDGTTTADKIIVNNTSTSADIRRTGLNTNGVVSFYAKPDGFDFIGGEANVSGGFPTFRVNLITGQSQSNDGSLAISTQNVGNGWWRVALTGNFGNNAFIIAPRNDYVYGFNGIVGADGVKGIFLWGAQLEAGAFPTSYIPTGASTVTRAADVASMTGTNFSSWYRQDEGTFVANVLSTPSVQSLAFDCGNNAISSAGLNGHIFQLFSTSVNATTEVSGVTQASPTVSFTGSTTRSAYGYKLNNFNLATNGTLGTLDTSGTVPTLASQQLVIGTRFNGTLAINKPIARLAYYPVRLPDAQLQALTAT